MLNKITKIFLRTIFILAVLIPLALFGTCALLGGGGMVLGGVYNVFAEHDIINQLVSIFWGALLLVLGYFVLRWANRSFMKKS